MLSSMRLTAVRIPPRPARAMSVGSSAFDSSTLSDAFSALGADVPGAEVNQSRSIPPPSSSPPIMNIPPAEDPLLHYITSSLLKHGHRAKASRITSRTLLHIHAFTRAPPLPILREAIRAASPAVRSLMHRSGAKTVPKPIALGEKQQTRFAVQWILKASEKKSGRTVEERLARELIAVVQGTSEALKKKEEVHRFAMINRHVPFLVHSFFLPYLPFQGECTMARMIVKCRVPGGHCKF